MREAQKTVVIKGEEETTEAIANVLSATRSSLDIATNSAGPSLVMGLGAYRNIYPALKSRGVGVRFITEITKSNLNYCEQMRRLGIKLRHLSGIRGNILINESEYLASISVSEGRPIAQIIYSNVTELIQHERFLFETLWNYALPARNRIEEIRHGTNPSEARVINDPELISSLGIELTNKSKKEVLLVVPSGDVLKKNQDYVKVLDEKARGGVLVRVLVPMSESLNELLRLFPSIDWRNSPESLVGFGIYDKRDILMTQYLPGKDYNKGTLLSAIHSSNEKSTPSIAAIFEALWETSDLRQKDARMRRQAQLLQDILTHDLRNYNQVIKLSAELLKDELKENILVQSLTENMIHAIDGSSSLLERAKGLGKIMAEDKPILSSCNLKEMIDSSVRLIRDAERNKRINVTTNFEDERAQVVADDLLNEAFLNIFSNSVKYTDVGDVEIQINVALSKRTIPDDLKMISHDPGYWKILISDKGRGIPNEIKPRLFSRYLESAKGSGLGMSIVHALIVERYGGMVNVRDRALNDSSKGTTIEIFLHRAPKVQFTSNDARL